MLNCYLQQYSETHLSDAKYNREFHLERVEEVQFVRGDVPLRVETNRVDAAFDVFSFS